MKWVAELNGQGAYWWKAETPLGPVYAEYQEKKHPGPAWYAYWHPYEVTEETPVGHFQHEGEARDAAEKWIKARALKDSKRLARFAA